MSRHKLITRFMAMAVTAGTMSATQAAPLPRGYDEAMVHSIREIAVYLNDQYPSAGWLTQFGKIWTAIQGRNPAYRGDPVCDVVAFALQESKQIQIMRRAGNLNVPQEILTQAREFTIQTAENANCRAYLGL